jgi:ubiquitin-conjugating enzyme (huntingtin interacting protein 2)
MDAKSMAARRVQKELGDIERDPAAGIVLVRDPSNSSHITGTIKGPDDTPYAGGLFSVDILIPSEYPMSAPKMKFLTKIWHPNVSSVTGAICLDILKDQWSPALTLKTALLSLQALMCAPEPSDPQDAEVANMYTRNYEQWKTTASFWTQTYAADPSSPSAGAGKVNPAVQRLMDMGFEQAQCQAALLECKGDETAAVEKLLGA